MADVITRFKLETTQYDSKLRDAAKGLSEYTKQATMAGNEFGKFTQKNVEVARSFGTIATSATNSKDKVKELVGAYNDVAKAYNALTKDQQSSDFGKALAQSMNTLKGRISEAKTEMNGTSSVLDSLKGKFMINVDALKLLNWGLTAAKKALDVAKDAFFQSEANIDEWGRIVESSKGAYDIFLDTINNGNWSNFFSNLSTAIKGSRDLYDALDRLGSIKANNKAAIAIVQQQIQQLRLLKQQGKNVDDQIKAATAQLALLQNQAVGAGKTAGKQSMFNTIRNSVNSIDGGASVSDKSIQAAISGILSKGQVEFDKYARNVRVLESMAQRDESTTYMDNMGMMHTSVSKVFDINLLTKEQQRQYKISKAITDRESEIKNGIDIYAQAVQEETAATREQFRGNRYALQGSGHGGGGNTEPQKTKEQRNNERIKSLTDEYIGAYANNIETISEQRREAIRKEIASLQKENAEIQRMKDEATGKWKPVNLTGASPGQGVALGGVDMAQFSDQVVEVLPPIQQLEVELERLAELQAQAWSPEVFADYQRKIDETKEKLDVFKGIKKDSDNSAKSFHSAASAIGAVGNALNSIEDPTAKIMGIIAEAIAGVAAGAGQAISAKDTTSSGWAWIGAAAAITASMVAMIAEIHNATGYAHGGVIEGTSFSGDNQWARVNAGETILNRAQTGIIASALQDSARTEVDSSSPYVTGETIILGANNHLKRSGQGEIVTTGMLRRMGVM